MRDFFLLFLSPFFSPHYFSSSLFFFLFRERFDNPSGTRAALAPGDWKVTLRAKTRAHAHSLPRALLRTSKGSRRSTRSSLRRDFQDDTPQATRSIRYLFGYAPGHGSKTSAVHGPAHRPSPTDLCLTTSLYSSPPSFWTPQFHAPTPLHSISLYTGYFTRIILSPGSVRKEKCLYGFHMSPTLA